MPLITSPRRRSQMEVEFFLHPDPRASAAADRSISRDARMVRFSMPSGTELVRYATPIDIASYPAQWAQFEARLQQKTDNDGSRIEQKHSRELDTGLHIEQARRGDLQKRGPVKEKGPSGPPSTPSVRVATALRATSASENIDGMIHSPSTKAVTHLDSSNTPSPAAAAATVPAPPQDRERAEEPDEQFASPSDAEAEGATSILCDHDEKAGPTAASPRQRRHPVPRRTPPEVTRAVADALVAGLKTRKALAAYVKERTRILYSDSQIGRIVKKLRSS
jgi:hypothetical protein